jgi:hypothetical protein
MMREDYQVAVRLLRHLTSQSPTMMNELWKQWELIDTNNINIRARYT